MHLAAVDLVRPTAFDHDPISAEIAQRALLDAHVLAIGDRDSHPAAGLEHQPTDAHMRRAVQVEERRFQHRDEHLYALQAIGRPKVEQAARTIHIVLARRVQFLQHVEIVEAIPWAEPV